MAFFGTVTLQASDAGTETASSSSSRSLYPIPGSQFFSYDIGESAAPGYLQTNIKKGNWIAHEVRLEDIPFQQSVYNASGIMSGFADGQLRAPADTEKRIIETWIPRSKKGQPHSGLTVLVKDEKAASAVAGLGDRAGTSEIALATIPKYQDGKLASALCKSLVEEWAPDVRRIGLSIGLDEQYATIVNAFRCFGSDSESSKTKILNQLDATASPSNVGSWLVLTKNGFRPARCGFADDYNIIDLTTGKFEGSGDSSKLKEDYSELEAYLLVNHFVDKFTAGKRCVLIDHTGKEFTISRHTKYDRLKFHFERPVELG